MKKMKKLVALVLACAMAASLAACSSAPKETAAATEAAEAAATEAAATEAAAVEYPTQPVTAVSTYDTTSGTYSDAMRICGLAEQYLGGSITVTDHAGGSGAVGTEFVNTQASDGYTLLCGTDSADYFGVMELSDITYDDFVPVLLAYGKVFFLIGGPDSKYTCLQDVIDDAKANPGKITVASTGKAAMVSLWFSIFETAFDIKFNYVEYSGNGDALTALMGGHADLFITNTQQGLPYVESKDVTPITLLFDNDIPQLAGVEKLSESFPELAQYSGFGNYFQVSVKSDTPQSVIDQLTEAFSKAYEEADFQQYISDNGHLALGLSGQEAVEYQKKHQQISSYILYDTGVASVNPADLGIERLQ